MGDDDQWPDHPALEAFVRRLRQPVHPRSRAAELALATLRVQRRWRGAGWAAAAALALLLGRAILAPADAVRPVRFSLRAPASARVALIGDFNDWDARRTALRSAAGEWAVTLPLHPGRYRYSFVVDGSRWVADPRTAATDDDFGTPTSEITVGH